jgi:hypothetical protein
VSHDLRKFQWAETSIGGGADGDPSPRDRGVAVLNTDVAANTTISTSTNATGTFLDYSGVTFAANVEIHINGVLMRCGASAGADFDVYPTGTAANGDFACEFNLIDTDVIQMFIGGGGGGAGRAQTLIYTGRIKATGLTNVWYGPNPTMPYWTAEQATPYSNTPLPGVTTYYALPLAQFTGNVTEVQMWFTPGSNNIAGNFQLVKVGYADASSVTTESAIGTTLTVTNGKTANTRYDLSTTFSSSNSISAGEGIAMFYRSADGLGSGYLYYTAAVLIEES